MEFKGESAVVSLTIHWLTPPVLRHFFSNTPPFFFAQITKLKLEEGVGPLVSRNVEFTNLEHIELERRGNEDIIFEVLSPPP